MMRPLLALFVIGAAVYARALGGQFVWDDFSVIVLNDHLRSWRGLPVLLTSDMYRYLAVHVSDYYRPLTMFSFFLDYQVWGLRPFGYHLTSIVLHLVTGLLVYRVWARLSSREAALVAALVWVVHPVHVEAVAYITSRGEIWYTLWALVALLLFLRERPWGSLGALAVALLSKEMAVVVPAVLGVVGLARGWPRRRLVGYLGLCGLVVGAYILLRVFLGIALTVEHGRVMPAWQRGLLALKVLGEYGELMVWPRELYFPRAVAIPEHLFEPGVLLGVLLLGSAIAGVLLSWKKHPAVAIGVSWFLLGLLPHSNVTLLNVPVAEHWLYFPLVGLCGVVGVAVTAAERRLGRIPVGVGVGIVVGLLALRTFVGIADWRDELRVGLRAIRGNPESPMAWRLLGNAYARRGDMEQAAQAFKNVLAIDPRDTHARRSLGQAFAEIGNYVEAERHLRVAATLDTHVPWNHYMLGEVFYKQGRTADAVAAWQRAIAVDPRFTPAQSRLREVQRPRAAP